MNASNDVLPHEQRQIQAIQPACNAWHTSTPRGDLLCDMSAVCHPVVSPTAAPGWSGAPPMWFAYGERMVADEGAIMHSEPQHKGLS